MHNARFYLRVPMSLIIYLDIYGQRLHQISSLLTRLQLRLAYLIGNKG